MSSVGHKYHWCNFVRCLTQYSYQRASFPPAGEVFLFNGSSRICPACHLFIAKNLSPAVRLPRPMLVRYRVERGYYVSAVTGRPFYYDGHEPPALDRPRWFVHERCWDRIQRAIAAERGSE